MYQSIMLLLVTAVVTIITTVVTVRLTMTGRLISQGAKTKLRTNAKLYGVLVASVVSFGSSVAGWLVSYVNASTPINRSDVSLISFFIGLAMLNLVLILFGIAWAIAVRRALISLS